MTCHVCRQSLVSLVDGYPFFILLILSPLKNKTKNCGRQASAAGDDVKFDPFQRRSCRPKILWSVGRNNAASPTVADAAGTGAAGMAGVVGAVSGAVGTSDMDAEEGSGVKEAAGPDPEQDEGVDILEAGRMALEKKLGAIRPKTAPRQGAKLTIGKYLQKARPPVDG